MIRLVASILPAAPTVRRSELLVLLPSLGTTTSLWGGAVAALRADNPALRVLSIDLPGHGASPAASEPFTIADVADAVLRVVDEAGGGSFHIAGVSLGGSIALEVAAQASDRVLSLAMFCSGAQIGSSESWTDRARQVRASGTSSLVVGSAKRWFAPDFLEADGAGGAGARTLGLLLDVDDASYANCAEALGSFDLTVAAGELDLPALLVSGAFDEVTTTASMSELAASMPRATFVELAGASHLAVLEKPGESAALLGALIAGTSGSAAGSAEVRENGMEVRRAVLGDAHVDASVAASTPETAPFQDFITRYAWGEIWARPELTRRERSIATLASLVTGGHDAEISMHVRAARRNGLSDAEISEVIMHTALYAGLPAANSAFALAKAVFAEPHEATAPDPRGVTNG